MRITERQTMDSDRISNQINALPPETPQEVTQSSEHSQKIVNRDELLEWRKSLETKCQLLNLLDKGGYVKDIKNIRTDVERALADLNEIIKALPDEEFALNTENL